MITVDGVKLRNLQERVCKNELDIARIIEGNIVLGELGIRVVGQTDIADNLPPAVTYIGEYGDAYLVGASAPYDFYIFTRPFDGSNIPTWFNLGSFPVAGPQGPQGQQGIQGPQGTRGATIHAGAVPPTQGSIPDLRDGDFYIDTSSKIFYSYKNGVFKAETTVGGLPGPAGPQGRQGPQGPVGPAGPRGPQGPVGAAATIVGTLSSVDALPPPTESIRHNVYVINDKLYGIIGVDSLSWADLGPLGASGGTKVYSNDVLLTEFDADTKVDKTTAQGIYGLYSFYPDGSNSYVEYTNYPQSGAVAQYDYQGMLNTSTATPTDSTHVISKSYLDSVLNMDQIAAAVLQRVYPVGSAYINFNDPTDPATILGFGTWDRITDCALYGISDNEMPNETKGSNTHSHTLNGAWAEFRPGDQSNSTWYANTQSLPAVQGGGGDIVQQTWTANRATLMEGFGTTTDAGLTEAINIGGSTDTLSTLPIQVKTCYMWQRIY